ncbi:hypothetical protein [Cellulomonas gilvus]|uniref:Uncharacterized protein n=1 Tax=Cellulomonas gilvus (strain ATCC 13127 / NRRL B-14078) TaxID=593907 RepID=F8A6K1_CELGA|nr:hypothetical protein [Cellulomonas gilvus]AEI13489.1 hypothetical protein Celgi_2997 [Cellulomonas gilvus ATCC 13127]
MIFFGWGRNSKTHELSPHHVLVLTYAYFHVFWLFRITVPQGYGLATLSEYGWATRPMTPLEVDNGGYKELLSVSWWWRWGLLVGLAGVVLLVIASSLTGS